MKYLILFLLPILAHADITVDPSPLPAPSPRPRPSQAAKGFVQESIPSAVRSSFKGLKATELYVLGLIQSNPDGLTPQQVFTSFGADQCQVYSWANATMTYLNAVKAATIPAWTISVTKAGVGAACTITVN